jgi:hypothetical protein
VLTDELRGALRAATEQQPFEPDVSRVPARVRQLRRRRRVVWVSVSAAGIGVVATAGVLATTGSSARVSPSRLDKGGAALIREVDNWGPTRGSFASDKAFLAHVKQEWLIPTGSYYGDPAQNGESVLINQDGTRVVTRPDRSRHLTGDVKVLFAGQTPDGPAAVVAQRTTLKDADMYLGVMLPTSDHDLHLVAAYTPKMYAQHEVGDPGFDTNVIDFKTTAAGDHLVVLPANPADTVSISLDHTVDSTGHVHRDWSAVPTSGGVAAVTASGRYGFWDTLIGVSDHGAVADESQVWDVLAGSEDGSTDSLPPQPDNVVEWPLSDQGIGGSVPGGGYSSSLNDQWIARYANTDEPYAGRWWVTGSPLDRHMIVVEQLWFYGDPAHTVVLRVVDKDVQLLSDTVTDPSARPLVFLRLPGASGWLVVAGPDTTITGWREVGTSTWSGVDTFTAETYGGKPVATKKSTFIRSTADHIQVQLDVNGRTQIASK